MGVQSSRPHLGAMRRQRTYIYTRGISSPIYIRVK